MRIESPRSMTGNRVVSQELRSPRERRVGSTLYHLTPRLRDGDLPLLCRLTLLLDKEEYEQGGTDKGSAQLSFNDHWLDCQCLLGTVAGALL